MIIKTIPAPLHIRPCSKSGHVTSKVIIRNQVTSKHFFTGSKLTAGQCFWLSFPLLVFKSCHLLSATTYWYVHGLIFDHPVIFQITSQTNSKDGASTSSSSPLDVLSNVNRRRCRHPLKVMTASSMYGEMLQVKSSCSKFTTGSSRTVAQTWPIGSG